MTFCRFIYITNFKQEILDKIQESNEVFGKLWQFL